MASCDYQAPAALQIEVTFTAPRTRWRALSAATTIQAIPPPQSYNSPICTARPNVRDPTASPKTPPPIVHHPRMSSALRTGKKIVPSPTRVALLPERRGIETTAAANASHELRVTGLKWRAAC